MEALFTTVQTVLIADMIERGIYYVLFGVGGYLLFWRLLKEPLQKIRLYQKAPEMGQLRHEALHSLQTMAVWALLSIIVAVLIHFKLVDVDAEPSGYGWIWYMVSFPVCLLLHDTYFYWTHRAIHHPRVYKRVHAAHHKSINPTSMALFSFSALEAVVEFGIVFLFLLMPLHWTVLLAWGIFMAAHNMVGHLGFETHVGKRGGIWVTATHHAQHHRFFAVNYGLYFRFWDIVMETEHEGYGEALQRVKSGGRLT